MDGHYRLYFCPKYCMGYVLHAAYNEPTWAYAITEAVLSAAHTLS